MVIPLRILIALLCLKRAVSLNWELQLKGGTHTCFIDAWISTEPAKRI